MNKRIEEHELTRAQSDRRRIVRALLGAGLLVAAAMAVAFARSRHLIDEPMADRLSGMFIGLVLVVTGNSIPKTRERHAASCSPSRNQSFRRFAGWTFVLSGLGYMISWLVVPIEHAGTVAVVFVVASIVLVLPRMIWCVLKRRPTQPAAS